MPPTDPPIDVTDILAQPREFAQKLSRVERERAELIETVARLRAENDFLNGGSQADKQEIDHLLAENERLTNVIGFIENELQMSIGVGPFWDVMHDVHLFRGSLIDLCLAQLPETLSQPATAQPLDDDGVCKCGHARGQHRGVCMIFPCKCMEFTAPARAQTRCECGHKWSDHSDIGCVNCGCGEPAQAGGEARP